MLDHVRDGRPNAEIAVRLGVSVTTVKTHVSSILAKTGASDRRALAEWEGRPASAERRAAHALALPLPFLGRGMKEALMSTLKLAGLGAGALVAVAAVVVGFALFADGGEGDDGVVAVIEGIEVTEEEWEDGLAAEPDPMFGCLREMVETMDPTDTTDVRNSLAFMDELDQLEEEHSPEAALLGAMVIGLSTEAEARERGLTPTDAEVAESVARTRQMTEAMLADESSDQAPGAICYRRDVEATIAEVGEDRYWSEVAPERSRRSLLLSRLWVAEDVPPGGGLYGLELARSADVELGRALDGVVTLDEMHAYLDHYERLAEESAAN